jgi:hypothetical protein
MFFACTQTTAGTGVLVWVTQMVEYFLARPFGGTSADTVDVVPPASVTLMTPRKGLALPHQSKWPAIGPR